MKKPKKKTISFDWGGWLCATLANYSPCARCGCFFIYHKQKSTYMRHKWRIGQMDGMREVQAKTSCDCDYCLCFCITYIPTFPSQKWTHCIYDPWSPIKPVYQKTSFNVICEYCHNNPCICHVLIHLVTLGLSALKVAATIPPNDIAYFEGSEDGSNSPETQPQPNSPETQPQPVEITGRDREVRPISEGTQDTTWFTAPRIGDGKKGTGKSRKGK